MGGTASIRSCRKSTASDGRQPNTCHRKSFAPRTRKYFALRSICFRPLRLFGDSRLFRDGWLPSRTSDISCPAAIGSCQHLAISIQDMPPALSRSTTLSYNLFYPFAIFVGNSAEGRTQFHQIGRKLFRIGFHDSAGIAHREVLAPGVLHLPLEQRLCRLSSTLWKDSLSHCR